jgi:F-type H+-transporting ATPase subunit epsilon
MATAAGSTRIQLSIISPERVVFEGEGDQIVVPAWDGEVGILRDHAPMMLLLGTGDVRVRRGETEERFFISGGFLQVIDNKVTVLSERAEAA